MVRMDKQIPGAAYKQELDNIKTLCMDEDAEKRYCAEIKMLAKREKQLEEEIHELAESLAEIKTDVDGLKSETDGLCLDIEKTRADQEQISSNFEKMKKENEEKSQLVQGSLARLEETVDVMRDDTKSTLAKTRADQEQVASNFEKMKKENEEKNQVVQESLAKLEDTVEDTRSTLANIEGNVSHQISREISSKMEETEAIMQENEEKNQVVQDSLAKLEETVEDTRSTLATVEENVSHRISREISSKMEDTEAIMHDKLNVTKENVEEQTLERIKGHRNDQTFVVTDVIEKGEKILYDLGMVMYSGPPGSGKTKNALEIMRRVQDSHPDWTFLKLNDVRKWNDCKKPAGKSLVFLEDFLGRTNIDVNVINDGEKFWPDIYTSVKNGTVKVIMTVRKNILDKNFLKIEQYELFKRNCIIDLTANEHRLSDESKRQILLHHCRNNNIIISPCSEIGKENYAYADQLDEKAPVLLNEISVSHITSTNPVIGFPLSCYLFANNRKNTKQGIKFFSKPTEYLLNEVKEMLESESLKIRYCLLCYMLIENGKINLNDLDGEMFQKVIDSVDLCKTPRKRDLVEAAGNLNHRFILELNVSEFEFLHQTVMESVAICFYDDNPSLLLDTCSEDFIKEFIRGPDYKKSEGDIVIKINQKECGKIATRFLSSLRNGQCDRRGEECQWVTYPIFDSKQFVDCFIDIVQINDTYKELVKQTVCDMFSSACKFGKTYLIDRLFNMFRQELQDVVNWKDLLDSVIFRGHAVTVTWLLDHDSFNFFHIQDALLYAHTDTLTAMIAHPSISVNDVLQVLKFVMFHCNSETVHTMLTKWPDLHQGVVYRLLIGRSFNDDYRSIEVILRLRDDVITQKTLSLAFTSACIGNAIETVDLMSRLSCAHIDTTKLHIFENKEHLTNLHIAAFFGRVEVFKRLMELGLSIDDRTINGLSILQMSVIGYAGLCKGWYIVNSRMTSVMVFSISILDFIQGKSDILNSICNQIQTQKEISFASRHGIPDPSPYKQLFDLLVNHPNVDLSDFNITIDRCGSKLVHYCVMYKDLSSIQLLHGINRNFIMAKNSENVTGVHLAALLGMWDMFIKLVELGLNPSDRSASGVSVLQMAMLGYTHRSCLANVLGNSGFIESKCDSFSWYLHTIGDLKYGDTLQYEQILSYLINHKDFDPTDLDIFVDFDSHTLAHYCVIYNSLSILELLCKKHSSSIFGKNIKKEKPFPIRESKYTPLQLAVLLGRSKLFDHLHSEYDVEDTDAGDLHMLLAQGRHYADQSFDQEDPARLPGFLYFLPPSSFQKITFGSNEDYNSISAKMQR